MGPFVTLSLCQKQRLPLKFSMTSRLFIVAHVRSRISLCKGIFVRVLVEYRSTSCYRLFAGTSAKPIIRLARRRWKNVGAGDNGSRSKGISKREVIPFIVAQTSNCQRVE